jgi:hypothetical protein
MFVGQMFALNLLFGAIVSAQMVAATSAGLHPICYSTASGSGDSQDNPASGLRAHACIVCAFSAVAPLIPVPTSISFVQVESAVAFSPFTLFDVDTRRRRDPRLSQGPPQQA